MGIQWSRAAITNLLSGGLVPLSFFPEGARRVFEFLPFRYIVAEPAAIFLNQIELSQMANIFALELFWVVVLFVMGKLFFKVCIRKVTIYGG
jgi:ABC-2 type transport system permease protein